ncbi:hypothetical protein Cni_G07163 [Canna indica]|uniref:Uncharacterized protein n=1 Tax=Canna indica TaxID=4628 RepID=A0AAQ3JYM7_9LILI|nr:hypothetical protein Cni_G07163 [Canna indica]
MDSMRKLLVEKLTQLLLVFMDAPGFLAEKVDQVFPPETRKETLHQWVDFGLRVVLLVMVVRLLLYCCGGGGGRGRKMKAPGRHGARMPRSEFEANPRGYFVNHRAKKGHAP